MPEEKKKLTEEEKLLQYFSQMNFESENNMSSYKARWVKNTRLVKGIYPPNEKTQSKVRKRSKIYFRKIWATKWRWIASMYSAFLKDRNKFEIEAVDTIDDPRKARVLKELVDYRVRQMYCRDDLFIQFIHAFQDIFDFCLAGGKMCWSKEEKRPKFILYPPEQLRLDMEAETPRKMKYLFFINYYTKEDIIEEFGEDIDFEKLVPVKVAEDTLRASRWEQQRDPLRPVTENMYPSPDKLTTQEKESFRDKYEIWEVFWREGNKIKYAVTQESNAFLKKPKDSPYGNNYFPFVPGMCLLEAHKLIGEGFPQPLEGPEKSINHILNMRKDELALSLSPMHIVNKWANVDYQSLNNYRPGGIVKADSTQDAVEQLQIGNVTQAAYLEASVDEEMIQEMGGYVDIKQGTASANQKATTAQINLGESNEKIDLFIAIVAETFVKNFYFMLIQLEQMFETNETAFRIANEPLRRTGMVSPFEGDIQDIDDFDADLKLEVSLNKVAQQLQINQMLLAMDKMIMANQSLVSLMGIPGAVPPQGLRFFDITKVMEEFLPLIGRKNYKDFFFQSGQPVNEEGGTGRAGNQIQGTLSPQIGGGQQGMQGLGGLY